MSASTAPRLVPGRVVWPVVVCVLVGLAIFVAGTTTATGDYGNPVCDDYRCDDAAPALEALSRGDIRRFFREQPGMGPVSLILRAPAVALARAADASDLDRYRIGAAVCIVLALLIVIWLAREALARTAPRLAVAGFVAVMAVAILWTKAIQFGHPEEPLAAALVLAAAVLAARRERLAAGLVLGAAVATKEWALLAVAPIALIAGLGEWKRLLLPALAVVVLLNGTMAVASPTAFKDAHAARVRSISVYGSPLSVWWRFGDREVLRRSAAGEDYAVHPPKLATDLVRPGALILALLLSYVWWRRARGRDVFEPLALLALILLLRAALDTVTSSYHIIPMLMTLATWELFARRRLPVVAAAATVCLQLTFRSIDDLYTMNTVYLAWTVPLALYLGVACFRRQRAAAPS
jgi:hypothetical protein